MKTSFFSRCAARLPLFLFVAWLGVALFSWVANAAGYSVGSLLSADGVRWSFTHAVSDIQGAGTVYLIVLLVTLGTLQGSGWAVCLGKLVHPKSQWKTLSMRQRRAFVLSLLLLGVWLVVFLLLVLPPHALLLNVTGNLFPSPFLGGFFMYICFGLMSTGLSYASLSGALHGWDEYMQLFFVGIRRHAWLILSYLLAAQLLSGLRYVLGISYW